MATKPENLSELLQQYGGNLIRFAGTEAAIYERHLIFDRAIDPKVASAREGFEALAHTRSGLRNFCCSARPSRRLLPFSRPITTLLASILYSSNALQ
jgi:hypothetical protein